MESVIHMHVSFPVSLELRQFPQITHKLIEAFSSPKKSPDMILTKTVCLNIEFCSSHPLTLRLGIFF